jgi:hypothetical protein
VRKLRDLLVIIAALTVIGYVGFQKVHAQNPALTPLVQIVTGPCKGNFTVSPAGAGSYCFGSDVAEYSINGGPITEFVPPVQIVGVSGITYNGTPVPVSATGVAAITGPTTATVTLPQSTLTGIVH